MAQTRELRVAILGDAKSAQRAFASMNKSSGRFAQTMKRAALVTGAALGGLGIAASKAAMEAEKVTAQTEAVLKSTKRAAGITKAEVTKLSTEIMNYSGMSDEAIQSTQNLLLTFTNIRDAAGENNDVFTQTTKIAADMSTALGQDLKSSAIQLGKALNDPITGVTALRRVGVSFSKTQTEQIKKMVESNDLLGAQKLILAELSKEFGGSAKAMGQTSEGQFNIIKENVGNLLEEIGGPLNKVLVEVLPKLGETLGRVLKQLAPVFLQLFRAAAPVIEMLGRVFARVLRQLMPALKPLIKILGKAFLDALKAIAPHLPSLARSLARILKALTPLIEMFAQLAAWLTEKVAFAIAGVVDWLADRLAPAIKNVTGFIKEVKENWSRIWGEIKEATSGFVQGIIAILDTILGPIDEIISKLLSVRNLLSSIHGTRNFVQDLGNTINDAQNSLGTGAGTGPGQSGGAMTNGRRTNAAPVNVIVNGGNRAEIIRAVDEALKRNGRASSSLARAAIG